MAFPVKTGDRRLKDAKYLAVRAELKRQCRAACAPCARCGRPIDYGGPYWITVLGRRSVNPNAFVAGHIIGRADGGTDDLSNLQPECGRCSASSGARAGAKRRWAGRSRTSAVPATASRWVRAHRL